MNEKILLAILPYWSPLIPPAGLASIKSFLQPYGYKVKTIDVISKKESLEFYYGYFNILKKCIPQEKRGTFYNIGHDLLQQHLMAHLYGKNDNQYIRLVKLLLYNSYYVKVEEQIILELNRLIENFYQVLGRYFLYLLNYEKPDVFGLTVHKGTLPASLFVLKLTREAFPHIKTVIGGGVFADSHAVGSPNFHTLLELTKPYVDKIFIGQGELLFLKYLHGQLPAAQRVYTQVDIESGILDFEDIDIPDYSDFNIYKYGYLPATASISCPYHCTFCNEKIFWGKFRKKNAPQTVGEMVKLNKKYNRQLFFMTDSLLNPVVTELAEEMIKQQVSLYYDTFFRVDTASTDIQNTMLWRRGGLYRVRLGIESGSQRLLDSMAKGITTDQIKNSLFNLAYAGIKTTTYWIIGHPGETEEDFQKTLDMVEELKDNIWQAECNPLRYYYNGQNYSDQWAGKRIPLYPPEMEKILVFQEWTLNMEPSREVTFERINRFIQHCKKLGIPNPYSAYENYEADKRWKELHRNAVPPLSEFEKMKQQPDDCGKKGNVSLAANKREDKGGFDF